MTCSTRSRPGRPVRHSGPGPLPYDRKARIIRLRGLACGPGRRHRRRVRPARGTAVIPTPEQARWMLEHLILIREFEERLKWLVEHGVPVGAVHLYVGQEAVAVGMCAALRQDDWIASTHRGHGHCIAKGVDVRAMMAELYGEVRGTKRGKGG